MNKVLDDCYEMRNFTSILLLWKLEF